jgi:hypothetical protein
MFWILGDNAANDAAVQADLGHLRANPDLNNQLLRLLYSRSIAEINAPLGAGLLAGEQIYVIAHAGYDDDDRTGVAIPDQPWINGRWLDEFAPDLLTKFTLAQLTGRTIWFLVCHTGHDLQNLATLLSTAGVRSARLYMPTDFMYISTMGIPHCLENQDDVDKANKEVAKYNSEFLSVPGSRPAGDGWAGCTIDAHGTVAALTAGATAAAVIARFDSNGEES